MELYGITGKKGHGKDTFAQMMVEANPEFRILPFAKILKEMTTSVFGIKPEQLHDPALKEVPFQTPIEMDSYIEGIRSATGLPGIQPAGCTGKTPREILQFFGTEYVRKTENNYWVDALLKEAASSPRPVVVPDTRFLNEAQAIYDAGGTVIKIVRIDAPDAGDGHASETELEKIDAELILGVRTGNLELPKKVAKLVATQQFVEAGNYHYPFVPHYMKGLTEDEELIQFLVNYYADGLDDAPTKS